MDTNWRHKNIELRRGKPKKGNDAVLSMWKEHTRGIIVKKEEGSLTDVPRKFRCCACCYGEP